MKKSVKKKPVSKRKPKPSGRVYPESYKKKNEFAGTLEGKNYSKLLFLAIDGFGEKLEAKNKINHTTFGINDPFVIAVKEKIVWSLKQKKPFSKNLKRLLGRVNSSYALHHLFITLETQKTDTEALLFQKFRKFLSEATSLENSDYNTEMYLTCLNKFLFKQLMIGLSAMVIGGFAILRVRSKQKNNIVKPASK